MLAPRLMVVMLLAGILASCSSTPKTSGEDGLAKSELEGEEVSSESAKTNEQPVPLCPQVAIVRELDTFLRTDDGEAYHEGAVKPDRLIAGAKMARVKGHCSYGKDGVEAKFQLGMVGGRGPLLQGLKATFPYFVAVVDPEGRIIDKLIHSAEIGFSSEKRTMDHDEALRVHIPLEAKDRALGASYRVLMGFQRMEVKGR